LRRAGREPERWHWVYTGTCFRLDHRGQTAGGRPVITQRGFVATRQGMDALREQLHAEALRRGLGQAAGALVIGDGAVWLWRLAGDRWAPSLPAAGLLPRRATLGGGGPSALWPGAGEAKSLAAAAGPATQARIGRQSGAATGGDAGGIVGWADGSNRGPGSK